jgi:hypothetical protein
MASTIVLSDGGQLVYAGRAVGVALPPTVRQAD